MAGELPEVTRLRLKLKAARALIRDLAVCCAEAERALEEARAAEPKEGIAHDRHRERTAA